LEPSLIIDDNQATLVDQEIKQKQAVFQKNMGFYNFILYLLFLGFWNVLLRIQMAIKKRLQKMLMSFFIDSWTNNHNDAVYDFLQLC